MPNLKSALCDVHQSGPLVRATITLHFTRYALQEDALRCSVADCDRCYSPQRGYFRATQNEFIDQGVPSTKPQCRHNAEPVYMFLMRKDAELLWVCPMDGCNAKQSCLAQS